MNTHSKDLFTYCYFVLLILTLAITSQTKNLSRDKYSKIISGKSHKSSFQDLFKAKVEKCNELNCLRKYGKCLNKTTCKCNLEYANFNAKKTENYQNCSYIRKKNIIPFLLEIILPIGLGHIYCENFMLFYFKLFLIVLVPLSFILMKGLKPNICSKLFE